MKNNNQIFNYNSEKILSIEFLYTSDEYVNFILYAKSNSFEGASSFCVSKTMLSIAIKKLWDMHKNLDGLCEINDYDSDAFITFQINKLGHLLVHGQIGGSHQDHIMRFKYTIDQSILLNLIDQLEKLYY